MSSQTHRRDERPRNVVIEVSQPFVDSLSSEQLAAYVDIMADAHRSAATLDEAELTDVLTERFAAAGIAIDKSRPHRIAEQMRLDVGRGLTIVTDGGRVLCGDPIEDQAHHVPGVVGTEDPMDPRRPWFS